MDDGELSRPPPAWPQVLSFLPPGPAAMGNLCPAGGGLLDLRVPWATLTEDSDQPGFLSRLGPITPEQARHLAGLAARDAAVQWRVIVTGPSGRAQAIARVPRNPARAGPVEPAHAEPAHAEPANDDSAHAEPAASNCMTDAGFDDPDGQAGLVRRVTVTISRDALSCQPARDLPVILARTLTAAARTAARAAERADLLAAADAAVAGGCAHGEASPAYRPPARLWEYVTARDLTCRFPTCRQSAWRCDLDHTTPYDKGGRTCRCNLGGLCRFHHQLKQHVRWQLIQPTPGIFAWTTPAGRTYTTQPDTH